MDMPTTQTLLFIAGISAVFLMFAMFFHYIIRVGARYDSSASARF
jgi:hypothetical protein